jgi:hypothetical protein
MAEAAQSMYPEGPKSNLGNKQVEYNGTMAEWPKGETRKLWEFFNKAHEDGKQVRVDPGEFDHWMEWRRWRDKYEQSIGDFDKSPKQLREKGIKP